MMAGGWGPGIHVEMALRALRSHSEADADIARLMQKHPDDFIYGCTSPDIIVGKKYAGYHYHCHNWRMGRLILAEAKSDRQRAAAYGYLMHLAMDVVAHNYYIPFKIVRSYSARVLSHTYWEMRFDLGVPEAVWKRIGNLTQYEIDEFDELLERVLRKTLFSFRTNKRIFNSIMILQKMRTMRQTLRLYASQSRWGIEEENRKHYVDLTWESASDFLKHPDDAACFQSDPAGLRRLAYAKNLRRRMRKLIKKKLLTRPKADRLVEIFKERLAVGLYRPDLVLPDVVDVL